MVSAPSASGPGPDLSFRFSTPVSPSEILASGTLTLLPVRVHSMEDVASAANRDLKQEWTAALGAPPSGPAGESPHGHVATVGVPECLPERMYMCAYIKKMQKTQKTAVLGQEGSLVFCIFHKMQKTGLIFGKMWTILIC
ncbi:hypothetical protein GGX14DRAFT_660513 [Mycena pura]|uniref:Uncharacterized protein n=1 Tax=Mycena pura TaxID=153505 RepID=A0AAD6V8M3_9AGAR|nr:hypothetical protein GGX14DRAFT_660513 [Mycena pura]